MQAMGGASADVTNHGSGGPTARLENFADLTPDERDELAALAGPPKAVRRGDEIRSDDDAATSLHLLLQGWAASALLLEDGARQLTALSLPGDLLGLPGLAVTEPLDSIVALSDGVVLPIKAEPFAQLLARRPRLAAITFLVSQEERMFAMERLAMMSRAPASARLAALFMRLRERAAQFSDGDAGSLPFPLTQQDIGDLIGVSAVHVNALLKEMKLNGIARVNRRRLQILDVAALVASAGVPPWRRARPTWPPIGA